MRGKLSDTPFPDTARRLSNDEVTGALEVTGAPGVARVFFRSGAVYWAMSPAPRARLGDRLVNAGFITQEQLDRALEEQEQAETRTKLGALLVDKDLVGKDVIRVFVQEQILDALFDLVRWEDGDWAFHPGDAVEDKLPIDVPVSQMLVEVSRRQNEWDQIQRSIPTLDAIPDHVIGGNAATAALEQDEFTMLASIDGARSVRDLAADLGYSEFEAGRIVYGLTLLGIVQILGEDGEELEAPAAATPPAPAPATEVQVDEGDLDAALADVLQATGDAAAAAAAPAPTDEDDIDVGEALEHALFGEEPEPAPAEEDGGLQVTVHFALDDGVGERSAHTRPAGQPAPSEVPAPAPPPAAAEPATPAASSPDADVDEPEPWVFSASDDESSEPAAPQPAGTGADAPPPAAADTSAAAPGSGGAAGVDGFDDFFAGGPPASAPAAASDDLDALADLHDAGEPAAPVAPAASVQDEDLFAGFEDVEPATEAPTEPTTGQIADDLDALVADLSMDDEAAAAPPPPPPGSSAPGAPLPGADEPAPAATSEPAEAAPAGNRGDVSVFLRELTQLNLGGDDEGGAPVDEDDDDEPDEDDAPPPTPSSAPPPRRTPPPSPSDDKKKKGLFGWGR